jgi:hypothetical protein
MKPYVRYECFRKNIREFGNKHFMGSNFFLENRVVYETMRKMLQNRTGQRWQNYKAHAELLRLQTHTHTHTHTHTEMCNTYFFSTKTMVTRTRHSVSAQPVLLEVTTPCDVRNQPTACQLLSCTHEATSPVPASVWITTVPAWRWPIPTPTLRSILHCIHPTVCLHDFTLCPT